FLEDFESNFAIGNFDALSSVVEQLPETSPIIKKFKQTAQGYIDNFDFAKIEELIAKLKV
ncbi:MAG: hypothetical protein RML72_12985, partial [Bacteroidia bacterium]|nr:hypothetical protein [Bacteroidia bacterium]MDW8159773.1 hypothetical protein [Bacteroidia bacterium]